MRSGPSRAGANNMSLMACEVCIEAITPSAAKRGMSASATTWACSIRKRGSAIAPIRGRHRAERLFVLVERDAVAAIADGVRLDLYAAPEARDRNAQDLLGLGDVQAKVARRIAEGFLERGAPAAERAVHVELDRPHGQARVAAAVIAAGGEQLLGVRGRPADRGVHADLQAPGGIQPAQLLDLAPVRARLLHRGPAKLQVVRSTRLQCTRHFRVGARRNVPPGELHRGVDQHAGGFAGRRVAQDLPAGRVGRFARDAGNLERFRIHDRRMAVDAVEVDGAVADHGIEIAARREDRRLPLRLDPVRSDDPRRSVGRRALGEATLQCRDALDARQVEAELAPADVREVGVGVREAGKHGLSRQVHDARAGGRQLARGRRVADVGDPLADREHRPGTRLCGIAGVDRAAFQQQGWRRSGGKDGRRGQRGRAAEDAGCDAAGHFRHLVSGSSPRWSRARSWKRRRRGSPARPACSTLRSRAYRTA